MEEILSLLQNVFKKCDENGSGVVETNKLIYQLMSQDIAWEDNTLIKEEFHKLLKVDEASGTHYISKEDFISSLLQWFKEYCEKEVSDNTLDLSDEKEDQDESHTSSGGSGEYSNTVHKSSSNSIEEDFLTIYYVPEGSILSRQDHVPEDSSMSESESPVSNERMRILESELTSLKQKNELVETANSTLHSQVSCLEDDILKYKNEFQVCVERLSSCNGIIKAHELRLEEAEEKISNSIEENKSKTIRLARLKYENSKLKGNILRLEKNSDNLTNEKLLHHSKIHTLKARIESLNEQHVTTMKENEYLKTREIESKDTLTKLVRENDNLKLQLESRDLMIQELNLEQAFIKKDLRKKQKSNVQIEATYGDVASDLSAGNSMVFPDENLLLDSTIPFETSLFAELHDKANHFQNKCKCSESSSSSVSTMTDHYISNSEVDHIVLLEPYTDDFGSITPPAYKDVAVQCLITNKQGKEVTIVNKTWSKPTLQHRGPVAKGFIILTFVIVVLLTVYAIAVFSSFPPNSAQCPKYCFLTLLEKLGIIVYEQARSEIIM